MRVLRRTPLHPQWLLDGSNKTARWVREAARGRVVDIGCADRWIEKCLPPGCDYIGIDYPATGKLMYGARPDVFADAARLPLPDASADTVIILEVVEHLRHPREALEEIARVLRPRGRLLLSMPFLYPIHDAPHDFQRYTEHGLAREIEAAGLRVESAAPNLGSAHTAGLIGCLALGGMAVEAIRRRSPAIAMIPLVAAAIPVVNVLAWLGGKLLPSWPAVTAGYAVLASKP
jgi:SAM-dependent methyltransferase